ncbi:hypothetical protein D0864_08329 [Hortaea werneckii]|uniref:Uncharacterized protein n=1 Tax=Hortaea werneckii TaxID=91943 RepID=A0A3M7EY39_HORWE|nr:hypothetical protein D0864_08329 [Hortaea werneckii]
MSIFYSASLLLGAFGNLIAASILRGLNSSQQGLISPKLKHVAKRRIDRLIELNSWAKAGLQGSEDVRIIDQTAA